MNKIYHIYKMNIKILNIVSIILLSVTCLFTFIIDRALFIDSIVIEDYFKFLLLFIGYVCFHEILHSIAYCIHGAKFKNITYGCALEKGVLYCLCKQNISKKNILISLMYPLFFIGLLTYFISIFFNMKTLLLLSIFNITGCSGDIIMFMFIKKLDRNIEYSEFDDEISFGIFTDKNISKIKHFGLEYNGTKAELSRHRKDKIQVSKFSFIAFCFLVIIVLLEKLI